MDTKIVGIKLNTPNNTSPFWTVFGKVVVHNGSGVPETVVAQLRYVVVPATPGTVFDESHATLPVNGIVSIPLEGVTPPGMEAAFCVEIVCNPTGNSSASLARLIAISVNPATAIPCLD
jgi:hypothetical protein